METLKRPTAYESFQAVKYFGSLDGLRAVSIIGVIWYHVCLTRYVKYPWLNVLGKGYIGVDLFFIISGFLITTLLLRERDTYGNVSLKLFYIRRSLRIFPLYYTVLLLWVAAVGFAEPRSPSGIAFWRNLPCFITYTANMFMTAPKGARLIFAFAWSLAAEEQFYLVWPSVVRFGWRRSLCLVPICLILLDQVFAFGLINVSFQTRRIITSIASPIAFGVIAALVLHSRRGYEIAYKFLGRKWSSLVAAAIVLLVLSWTIDPDGPLRDVVAFPMTFLITTCVIREDHVLAPLLHWRPLAAVGAISYGMYLMHMIGVHAAEKMLAVVHVHIIWVKFALSVLITCALAGLSYRYYESRFLQLKHRFSPSKNKKMWDGAVTPSLPEPKLSHFLPGASR
ncbi:MAG: acyltransferase family protein [Phycisphaerae bacterium]